MKKILIAICLIMGFTSTVYAGSFCCGGGKTKEQCCAEKDKMYCPSDNSCRTRCLGVIPPDCIGGCINPEGVCCPWCPSAEVCEKLSKCQKIGSDGCYTCVECDEGCPKPKCLNQEGKCCDKCPRTCPEGQCLINVDGCYQCGECGDDDSTDNKDDVAGDDDDDDDDDEPTETTSPEPDDDDDDDDDDDCGECEVNINGQCVPDLCCKVECSLDNCEECNPETGKCESKMTTKPTGECCDETEVPCCPLKEKCECIPNAEVCVETETESEAGACYCIDMPLFYCTNGAYARTICCNPITDGDACMGHCEPNDYWDAKDQSELCEAVEEDDLYVLQAPPSMGTNGMPPDPVDGAEDTEE